MPRPPDLPRAGHVPSWEEQDDPEAPIALGGVARFVAKEPGDVEVPIALGKGAACMSVPHTFAGAPDSPRAAEEFRSQAPVDGDFWQCVLSVVDEHSRDLQGELEWHHAAWKSALTRRLAQLRSELASAHANQQIMTDQETVTQTAPGAVAPAESIGDEIALRAVDPAWDVGGKDEDKDGAAPVSLLEELESSGSKEAPITMTGHLRAFVGSRTFEVISGAVVMSYVGLECVQIQRTGDRTAVLLGLAEQENTLEYEESPSVFRLLEHVANLFFLVELLLRWWVYGCRELFKKCFSAFDVIIVVASLVHTYLGSLFTGPAGDSLAIARMARVLKILKFARAFRTATMFFELRVLMLTMMASVMALFWSMVLLTYVMLACAMLLAQLLLSAQRDPDRDEEVRVWLYRHYGNFFHSAYTMFEITFSGGWPNYVRPVLEEVSPWFSLIFIPYVIFVVFAFIRIITALFLRTTMNAANADEDFVMFQKVKETGDFRKKFRRIFHQVDKSFDGRLDRQELQEMVDDPATAALFVTIELEVHEVEVLFEILDDGEGWIKVDDLEAAVQRLRRNRNAMESIHIMHEQRKIQSQLAEISLTQTLAAVNG